MMTYILHYHPFGNIYRLFTFEKISKNLKNLKMDKLERQRANIAMLEQNLEKYNDLTNQASKILSTFGNRLKKVKESSVL